jgi:hypothetical protein
MTTDRAMPPSHVARFVPDDFEVPRGLDHAQFRLRPLDIEYNERDYAAWTTSIEHIKATPGFVGEAWPHPMSIDANRDDLARHAADFAARRGFTYTVLDEACDVIGCVYIYPSRDERHDARVTSWVCSSRAALDAIVYLAISDWLSQCWPFARVDYARRPECAAAIYRPTDSSTTSPPSTR